jgi:hypothetical protein
MDDCAESQHDHVRLRKIGKLSAAIFAPFRRQEPAHTGEPRFRWRRSALVDGISPYATFWGETPLVGGTFAYPLAALTGISR